MGMDGLKMLIVIIISIGVILVGLVIYSEVQNSDACKKANDFTITNMEYHSSYTSLVMVGKIMTPIYHPERWTITYDSCEKDVRETTYIKYKVGQIFREAKED